MTHLPDLFRDHRASLSALVTAVRGALDADPDAGRSQDDRLRAWCSATTQFVDAGFWSAALDVHTTNRRAQAAEADRRAAETAAHERRAAHQAAQREAEERAAHLGVTHPRPKL